MYIYFVSFTHGEGYLGHGNMPWVQAEPINSFAQIQEIEKWLKKVKAIKNPVVMNFQLLKGPDSE